MVDKYRLEISEHFPFVILHNPIVMPNHSHIRYRKDNFCTFTRN